MEERVELAGGGRLLVRRSGERAVLEVCREEDGRGLYKAWICGPGGRMLLGTLLPEGGELRLRRELPVSQLEGRGCWPVRGGECCLAFAFSKGGDGQADPHGWTREEQPARLFSDPVLQRAAGQIRGALRRDSEEGFQLAVPFDPGRPVGLVPAFCFARLGQLNGKNYFIFQFNQKGIPVFSYKEERRMHTKGAT